MKKILLICIVAFVLGYLFLPLLSRPFVYTPPPFGYEFTNTTGDRVNIGSDGSLDTISNGTIMVWVLINTEGDGHIFVGKRSGAGAFLRFQQSGGSDISIKIERATSDLNAASSSNPITTGKPFFLAATWDINGASGDQQLFFYDPSTVAGLAEISSYSVQNVGSGAQGSDAANLMGVGNTGEGNDPSACACEISEVWIYNDVDLTLEQIQTVMWGGELSAGTLAYHGRFGANGSTTDPGDLSPLQQATTATGVTIVPNLGDDWGQ